MTLAVDDRIHSLEIPVIGMSLLVPSASIAEVINPTELFPVPGGAPWLLGAIGWRAQPVPVVSFEALMGKPLPDVSSGSKIVIFYPLSGAGATDFHGMLSSSEPRPISVTASSIEAEDGAKLPASPLIAAGVRIKGRTLLIPDFDAWRRAFYPKT